MDVVIASHAEPGDLLLIPRVIRKISSLAAPTIRIYNLAVRAARKSIEIETDYYVDRKVGCPTDIINVAPPYTPHRAHRAIAEKYSLGALDLGLKGNLTMILVGKMACSALHDNMFMRAVRNSRNVTIGMALTDRCLERALQKYRGDFIIIPVEWKRIGKASTVINAWTLLRITYTIGTMNQFLCNTAWKQLKKLEDDTLRNPIQTVNQILSGLSNIESLLDNLTEHIEENADKVKEVWNEAQQSLTKVASGNIEVYESDARGELVPLLAPLANHIANQNRERKPVAIVWRGYEDGEALLVIASRPGYPTAPSIARILVNEGLIRIKSKEEYTSNFEGIIELYAEPENFALARIEKTQPIIKTL